MDCKSNVFCQALLLFLVLPATLWGYSKSMLGWPQESEDASVDGSIDGSVGGSKGSFPGESGQVSPENQGTPPNTRINFNVSSPVPKGVSGDRQGGPGVGLVENLATSDKVSDDSPNISDNKTPDPERKESETVIEPSAVEETYNQVRVRKPTLPSAYDSPSGIINRQQQNIRLKSPFDYLGFLGVPTLVFSLLFFVMWGIISGRIQRIMF